MCDYRASAIGFAANVEESNCPECVAKLSPVVRLSVSLPRSLYALVVAEAKRVAAVTGSAASDAAVVRVALLEYLGRDHEPNDPEGHYAPPGYENGRRD